MKRNKIVLLSFKNAKGVDVEVLATFEGNSSVCYAFLGTVLIFLLSIAKVPKLKQSSIPFAKTSILSEKALRGGK